MPDNKLNPPGSALRGLKVIKSVSDLAQHSYGREATPEEKKLDADAEKAAEARAIAAKGTAGDPLPTRRRRRKKALEKKTRKKSAAKPAEPAKKTRAKRKPAEKPKTRKKKDKTKAKPRKPVDNTLTMVELRDYAKILEISNRSSLDKTQLIRSINRALKKR